MVNWYCSCCYIPQIYTMVVCRDHEGNIGICTYEKDDNFHHFHGDQLGFIQAWTHVLTHKNGNLLFNDSTVLPKELIDSIDMDEVLNERE